MHPEPVAEGPGGGDPQAEAELADAVGLALLVVLETLTPAERVAFVLHDMFDLSFEEIAPIVERSPLATRQLASRARRRVQGRPAAPEPVLREQRSVIEAFLAAARAGDLPGLLAVLAPDVVFRADVAAARLGSQPEILGAAAVAKAYAGRAQQARAALVDGQVGVLVAPSGHLLLVLSVRVEGGRIVAIDAMADPDRLPRLELAALPD
ncbi:sigma factor-like helix-turn-helix DNA-binding protein [Variovorax sp. LARHSF232]